MSDDLINTRSFNEEKAEKIIEYLKTEWSMEISELEHKCLKDDLLKLMR